jgi:transcription elongation factor Elf1
VGNLHCKVCGQKFQTGINYLSAAVDVYSDWIDACEDVAKDAAEEDAAEEAKFSSYASGEQATRRQPQRVEDDEDEDAGYDDD